MGRIHTPVLPKLMESAKNKVRSYWLILTDYFLFYKCITGYVCDKN
jgi:hypothetical protein